MLSAFVVLCGGLAVLAYGADRFVDGAAAIAFDFGVAPLLVGLVVVGLATSAPEMVVSAVAAYHGNPTLGIGNAIGSNITNIGLVIGVAALVAPMTVGSTVVRREFPLMLLVLLAATALLWDREISRLDGTLLLGGMFVMIGATVWLARHAGADDPLVAEFDLEIETLAPRMGAARAAVLLCFGLALLVGGSRLVVSGAVDIAGYFGISDIVVGLTVVAIGTSLPELAASVMSTLKNEPDIALGNVIGSNMFNALGVLALPGLIAPCRFGAEVTHRDLPYMFLLSVVLLLMCRVRRGVRRIGRIDGALLVGGFIAYQVVLYLDR